ncbi:hypothetical protein DY000_02004546, partial [Brassica cretica]
HNVTAVDLAASRIDLRRAETLRSFAEYIGPLMSLMETLSEEEKDVELAELLVRPQRLFSNETIDTSLVLTPERFGSVNRIFVLSDKDRTLVKEFQLWMIKNNPPNHDVELAELLVRPQRLFSNETIDTSLVLTPERFGSVNRIFVLSDKDRTLVKEFQLWMIKNNPPNHVEHIQDSDHMVMISKPLDLGDCLLSLAKKFA